MWVDEFGQQHVLQKSNETKAIPELQETIDCQENIIAIDAVGCQKQVVKQIQEQRADYVIGKKNQKNL